MSVIGLNYMVCEVNFLEIEVFKITERQQVQDKIICCALETVIYLEVEESLVNNPSP